MMGKSAQVKTSLTKEETLRVRSFINEVYKPCYLYDDLKASVQACKKSGNYKTVTLTLTMFRKSVEFMLDKKVSYRELSKIV